MIRPSELLEAVKGLLVQRYPSTDATYYTNLAPLDFKRPSFLVETGHRSVSDAGCSLVEVTQEIVITAFVEVDKRHNSHFESLEARAMSIQELFALEGLRVADEDGERVLHVVSNESDGGYDYAQVTLAIQYMDERPTEGHSWPLMDEVNIDVRAD